MKKTLLVISVLCLISIAYIFKSEGNLMASDKPEINQEELKRLITFFNKLETFPLEMEKVEKETKIPFKERFSTESWISQYGTFTLSLTINLVDGKRMLTGVSIEADPDKVDIPEMPPGSKFNESSYRYLPRYTVGEKLSDNFYRSLSYPDQKEYREVNGTDGRINSTTWKYEIDQKRGRIISEKEKAGFEEVVTGLLKSIKENRFESHLEEFKKKYPREKFTGHKFYGHTLTIVYFNDNKEGEYFGKHLEADGLKEYVGLHFHPEQHAEFLFAKPYLFDFFELEHLDALQKPGLRPYAGLKNTGTPNPPPPIDEATAKAMLPDISAAGHRKGGLAYYNEPRYVADGWNFWMPGFYPHDGKKVERYLKKDIYISNSFEILFSRKK